MTRLATTCAFVLAVLAFAPMKANAGVYVRAPYFSLNINRPWGYRYYRPYRYYGYRPYYRPYYRGYWGRPYYKRRY